MPEPEKVNSDRALSDNAQWSSLEDSGVKLPPRSKGAYTAERDGSLLDYLEKCVEGNQDPLFFGLDVYREIWEEGLIIPGASGIRLMWNTGRTDESYYILSEDKLEGIQLQAHSGKPGVHKIEDIINEEAPCWELLNWKPVHMIRHEQGIEQVLQGKEIFWIDTRLYTLRPEIEALQEHGARVRTSNGERDVLDVLPSKIDLLVTELVLPKYHTGREKKIYSEGLFLLPLLRERLGPDVPIIVMTAFTKEAQAEIKSAGALAVKKPAEYEAVLELAKQHLGD